MTQAFTSKIGKAPGSLIYVGNVSKKMPATVEVYRYGSDDCTQQQLVF